MSGAAGSRGGKGFLAVTEAEGDFEMNIAPIVDCFTVLIAYLLVSASFVSFGVLDVGVTMPGEASQKVVPDNEAINITIELEKDGRIKLETTGAEKKLLEIPTMSAGDRNYPVLTTELAALKAKHTKATSAVVWAENLVEYSELIKGIDVVKRTIPSVFVGKKLVK